VLQKLFSHRGKKRVTSLLPQCCSISRTFLPFELRRLRALSKTISLSSSSTSNRYPSFITHSILSRHYKYIPSFVFIHISIMRDTGGRSSQEPSPNFTYPGPIAQAKEVDPRDLYFNQDSQKKPQSTEPYRLSDVTRSADLDPIHQVKTIHLPPSAIYNTLYAPERENGAIYNLPMCTYQGSFNAPGPSRMYRYLAPKPYVTPYSPRIAGARLNPPIDPAPVNLNVLAPLTTNHPPLVNYENPYTAGKGDMAMFNPPMYTNRRNFSAPGSSTMHRGLPAYGSTFCTPQKGNHQSVFNPQTYTYGSHIPGPSTMYSPPAPGLISTLPPAIQFATIITLSTPK